jgi:uncharacterized protein (TIGR02246 family)
VLPRSARSPLAAAALLVPALALLAGCGGSPSTSSVDVAASRIAIVNMVQTLNAALAAGDTAAVDSLYAADAALLPAQAPRAEGLEAIHRYWTGAMAVPGFHLVLKAGPITFARSGELAVMTGEYEYAGTGPKGLPSSDVGKFVTVFESRAGRWRITIDTWNSDTPPALGG